ncbi:MAG TPA: hypothetical protein VLG15_15265 [Thermoanaerobaculia bacterium]|nr:hypothetical protein [Thermoanaerobaculia bacterium]
MGLFGSRPRWRDKDPAVRGAAVSELSDPDTLLEVLRAEEDPDVARLAADRVVRLGRTDLLVSKLKGGQIETFAAVQATVARLEAFQGEMAEAEQRRRAATTSDPAALLRVISETRDLEVALEALSRIHDQRALAKLVRGTGFTRVIDAARERITDPAVLKEIVADASFGVHERAAALERLGDSAFAATVATTEGYPTNLRIAALDLVREPAAVARIAKAARDGSVRSKALERVEDDEVCLEIATSDPDRWRRRAAVSRIRNPEVLERLVLSTEDDDVRHVAVGELKDVAGLERLARASDPRVREAVAVSLSDPALLRLLFAAEKNHRVQGAVAARLAAQDVLLKDAQGGSPERRKEAIARLRDRAALESIVRSDPDLAVVARARLEAVVTVEEKVRDLERRIASLKSTTDYRSDLELKVSGDSQVFESYMMTPAGRRSPLVEVERLEAEIAALRRSLD